MSFFVVVYMYRILDRQARKHHTWVPKIELVEEERVYVCPVYFPVAEDACPQLPHPRQATVDSLH